MAIMQHQNHLALAFGILGNVISGLVFLAPVSTFYRIYKKKSTEGFQSLPYLVALLSSTLWLYYAIVKKDEILLITINSIGCFIESIYIILFFIYATRDSRILTVKLFMALNVISFIMVFGTTKFIIHDSIRAKVLGWICVSFAVSVFAAPLGIVAEVLRTKSVEFMPFNLSLLLTVSAIVWFAYGLSTRNIHVYIPNVLGFGLGVIQIILYAIYRDGGAKKMEVMEEEPRIETVVEIPVGNTTFEQEIEGAGEEEEKDISRAKEEEEPAIESIIVTTPLENPTIEGHPVSVNDHHGNIEQEIQEEIQEEKK